MQQQYYAISSLGWGKGDTPDEARAVHREAQLHNYRPEQLVFKTRAGFEQALDSGPVEPDIWAVPEGTRGFVMGTQGVEWELESGGYVAALEDQLVEPAGWRSQG